MVVEESGYGVTAHGQDRPYTTLYTWLWRVTVMVMESNGYGGGE
jgi:hypothetical protein